MDSERRLGNVHGDTVLSAIDAAYIAGFLDGEGTITIVRSPQKDRRSGWKYQPTFLLANSDFETLAWIRETCGNGWIQSNQHRKLNAIHKTVYQFRLTAHQVRWVLPQVLPYLRQKHRQAGILLRFLDFTKRTDGAAKPDAYWEQLETWRCEIANLNRRGDVAPLERRALKMRESKQGANQWTVVRSSSAAG